MAPWLALFLLSESCVVWARNAAQPNPFMSLNTPPQSQQAILASVMSRDDSLSSCKLTGQIADSQCSYEEMDSKSATFFPVLDKLRSERYLRLYKVDLYKDCPFWVDNSLCMSRDCAVSKVDESNIPQDLRSTSLSAITPANDSDLDDEYNMGCTSESHEHTAPLGTCQCTAADFCHWVDEEWSPESQWVDLLDNPERFTGYSGTSAHRVWRAIYEENCFGVAKTVGAAMSSSAGASYQSKGGMARLGDPGSASAAADALSSLLSGQTDPLDSSTSQTEQCLERRVFYRLISGLHASISIHVCHDYLDQTTGEWSPNLACFVERIAQHPDRLANLYFTHTVLVRSLAKLAQRAGMQKSKGKASPMNFLQADKVGVIAPGLPSASSTTSVNLASLLLQALNAPPTFDEESMFDEEDPESASLRSEFRQRFRNVSRVMDCVGCDKCRLWGKLQVNGLGTALKILFESNKLPPKRLLQRSELVALINTVHRFSESIRAVENFRTLYEEEVNRQHRELSKLKTSSAERKSAKIDPPRTGKTSTEGRGRDTVASRSPATRRRKSRKQRLREREVTIGRLIATFRMLFYKTLASCQSYWRRYFGWLASLGGHIRTHEHSKLEL